MPLITEAELKKQIKSRSFSPVYVIYGSEQMYVKEYTKKLVEAVAGKQPGDFNLHTFGGEVNLDTLASSIGVVPFMSEYNCVVVLGIRQYSCVLRLVLQNFLLTSVLKCFN